MTYANDRPQLLQGTLSAVALVTSCLARIQEREHLNCYLQVLSDWALQQAAESDERFASGLARPLEGMIVAVKDNISVVGARLTCASRMLENFEPVYNATVVERLRNAGAIIIGKTNMDEFAMGSSNENSAFAPVLHPTHADRVPGGSSGGSAVAVAAGLCHVALGSDTGGSVRQPAAFCGVYGFKPTYGAVSRYGLVAFASSLDQIGMFANASDDVQKVLDVIGGYDAMDATSSTLFHTSAEISEFRGSEERVPRTSKKFGRIPDSLLNQCAPSIVQAYKAYVNELASRGNEVVEIALPGSETWIPTYFILATAEASSNLARYDGVRYGLREEGANDEGNDQDVDMITATRSAGFGKEVKRRIMLGTFVLSSGYHDAYYTKAQQARRQISEVYKEIFDAVDFLVIPTTPSTAFVRGAITDPVQMWLSDLFTVSANIAGIPAISIPIGADENGLPIGVQLQAPLFSDHEMLEFS